jgi:hypothetical protein
MLETSNYKLKKYQPTDSPDLLAGYNNSMDTIDAQIKSTNSRIDSLPSAPSLPDGITEFLTALGLSSSNAAQLGTTLKHFLNKTPATTNAKYTAAGLAKTQLTAEGLPFVPDSQ